MKKLVFVLFFMLGVGQASWGQPSVEWGKKTNAVMEEKMAIDANGNVYTVGVFGLTNDIDPNTGNFWVTSIGETDIYIRKLDANGVFVWGRSLGSVGSDNPWEIEIDAFGNIYLLGKSAGIMDIDPTVGVLNVNAGSFILKMDSNGNNIWVKNIEGQVVINDIAFDTSQNLFLVGWNDTPIIDFDPNASTNLSSSKGSFILKWDSNGNFIWVKTITPTIGIVSASNLVLDTAGNITIFGLFSTQTSIDFDPGTGVFNMSAMGDPCTFILRLDLSGNFIWAKRLTSTTFVRPTDAILSPTGKLILVGYFRGTADFDPNASVFNLTSNTNSFDIFVLSLNIDGSLHWAKSMGGDTNGDICNAVATDAVGNVLTTGVFSGNVDFDPGAGVHILSEPLGIGVFMQKLQADGSFMWAKSLTVNSAPLLNVGNDIKCNINDHIYICGYFKETFKLFEPNCILSNPTNFPDASFTVKYAPVNPFISFEPASPTLTPFSTTCIASTTQSFQVKGNNLAAGITVTAPTGYEISLTGVGYVNSLILTPTCGTVSPIMVYIRLKAGLTTGTYNGNIVLSSTGAASQNLAVTGTVQENDVLINIGLANSYCLNAPSQIVTFTWMSPSNLIVNPIPTNISINNIPSGTFNPSVLGVGSHTVRVTLTDVNGCTKTATKSIPVLAIPSLSNNVNVSYSTNQVGFTIIGLPAGSTYTVNGTPITEFIPSVWGAGTHTLVQSFTDANGCSNTLSKTITVTQPPTFTNSTGATCWRNTPIEVDANMTVTGATPMTGARVSFGAGYNSSQDRLVYPTPLFGVTGVFSVSTGVLTLTGNATTAQYQQIFRTIQYQNISGSPAYGTTRTINFTAGDVLPLYPCGSADAHFYKFIPAPQITWQNAKIAAEGQNYFGLQGYLATISCAEENNFAFNSIGQQGWIGASDDIAFTGGYSPNGEGQWYWVTGPEAGTRFWQGNQPGTPVNGLYNNWAAGEPNNFQNTNESFAHLLTNGRWNDYTFNNGNIVGYYIEFGGLATDPSIQNTTSSKQIQLATKLDFLLSAQYCTDAAPFNLIGTPTGGTFKINGNIATQFNANTLGVGTHTITYELAGCTITASKTTIVNALPTVSITGLQASYCSDVTTITLAGLGSPTGGTFRVNGAVATQFNPSTAGAGNYTIQYTVTNAQGCTKSVSQDVLVIASPNPTFTGLASTYCISQASFALQASPAGGTFKINGNDATQFNPQILGVGSHIVTYSFTNAQGCSKTISQNVNIAPLPIVSILGLADVYCLGNFFLAPTTSPNAGQGQFFINGNPMPLFNPNTFGVGTHILRYDFTDPNGCSASDTKTFQVLETPTVEFIDLKLSYCASQASFALQASPIGGTFKINGIDATNFDTQTLGVGKHIVQYIFAPPQGCGKTIEQEVDIFPVPTLAFVNLPIEFCSQGNTTVLEATPIGGVFFLNGVVNNTFNPANYAIGDIVTIRYDFTSANGCSNSITQQVRVVFSSSFEEDEFDIETCPITAGTPLEALTEQEEASLRASNGNLTYLWSNGATTRTIYLRSENDGGQYKVSVKNTIGCPLRAYTFNVTIKCNTQFFVPSAFTPNGDGKNDKWEIFGDDFTKLDLRVYNRWGEIVFITNTKEKIWDGTIGGKPAPAGVYVWTVSYENPLKKGVVEKKQGQVTILR